MRLASHTIEVTLGLTLLVRVDGGAGSTGGVER